MSAIKIESGQPGAPVKVEGGYEFTLETENNCDYPTCIIEVSGAITLNHAKVGSLYGFLFQRSLISPNFFALCDCVDDETQACSALFFEDDGQLNGDYISRVSQECNFDGYLHILSVSIDEPHRGKDLGVRLMQHVLNELAGQWTLCMIKPIPLDAKSVDLSIAVPKLSRYFARLGFKQAGDARSEEAQDYWYLDAASNGAGQLQPATATATLPVIPTSAERKPFLAAGGPNKAIQKAIGDGQPGSDLGEFRRTMQFHLLAGGDLNAAHALHVAIANNRTDLISILIELGADVNLADSSGVVPLHLAANHVNAEQVALLLAHGADLSVRDDRGRNALNFMREGMKSFNAFMRSVGLTTLRDVDPEGCERLLKVKKGKNK